MKLFGRRAKDASKPDVPPELKQYYQPDRRTSLRRHALLILPLLATLAIALLVVWGGVWLWQHKFAGIIHPPMPKSSQQATRNQPQSGQSAPNAATQPPASPAPAPPAQTPTPPAPAQTAPGDLVNTGPGAASLLLPLAAAALAAVLFEVRQQRNVRQG